MRPLRLLLSLTSVLIALIIVLVVGFAPHREHASLAPAAPARKSRLKALFSFTSPSSLFPPSAVISLTDDNSTFFLARPAAFGPLLPSIGLSGPLWIGSGLGDDSMGRGELGCSDVPGWSDGGEQSMTGSGLALDPKRKTLDPSGNQADSSAPLADPLSRRGQQGASTKSKQKADGNDGTDDHLHHPLPASEMHKTHDTTSGHADIQSLQEGAEIAGKVVLLKRGGCGFLEKVKWVQRRGGAALVVGDDVRGGPLVRMYAHGDTSNITIPALFTSHTTAHLLSSLLPSGGLIQDLSPEDAAQLGISDKGGKGGKKGASSKKPSSGGRAKMQNDVKPPRPSKTGTADHDSAKPVPTKPPSKADDAGWLRSLLYALGFGHPGRAVTEGDSRRPPSSGNLDWVLVENWDDDRPEQKSIKTKTASKQSGQMPTRPAAADDFVIGEQDWRDPDLLLKPTANEPAQDQAKPKSESDSGSLKGGSTLPGSGEYTKEAAQAARPKSKSNRQGKGKSSGWLGSLFGRRKASDESVPTRAQHDDGDGVQSSKTNDAADTDGKEPSSGSAEQHDGLWVTLTPTSMASSPFFDTLLVLVISPLVTLTVVYALLLLRSRIRRRRWRAPKSVVERLPVRTYHTISSEPSSVSSPTATPVAATSTTPLLHPSRSRPVAPLSRARSRTTSEVPATSSSFEQPTGRAATPEEEKREAGLAAWRRRYGGRQKECVVCLEEYVDGISKVMSLPCGHEFHADCITPWLVTRRRTCPICKGDVVRSLTSAASQSDPNAPAPSRSRRPNRDDGDPQDQAAGARNDSPSASRPVPITAASHPDSADIDSDVEANWSDDDPDEDQQRRPLARDLSRERGAVVELSSSMRDMGMTLRRTLEGLREAAGLPQRHSPANVDRNR